MQKLTRSVINPFMIGVAGGSGSGKTTVSSQIRESIGSERIAYLQHDSYYHDYGDMTAAERARQNYDHPKSLDTPLLIQHLKALQSGESVEMPIYDFNTDSRLAETTTVHPARIVLVEGILIFAEESLRDLLDMRIFVDTDADLRFIRRLRRDVDERGRTLESVVTQYLNTVRPMHLDFVEPSKRYADIIVPQGGHNRVAMDMITSRIQAVLDGRG